jgi:hypothetical protein
MANNRMFLVHPSGARVMLARHYWSPWLASENLEQRLQAALDSVPFEGQPLGDMAWKIEYEHEND